VKELSKQDRALIESITGQELGSVAEADLGGGKKFLNNPALNKKGHHLVRCVLAWRTYEERLKKRGVYNDEKVQEMLREGVVIEKNVSEKDVPKLMRKYSGFDVTAAPPTPDKRTGCFLINGEASGRLSPEHIVHRADDDQYALHSDVFYPAFKGWIVTQKTTIKSGPFNYIRRSHGISENRLRWDYFCSSELPHYVTTPGCTVIGSFRVHACAKPEKESVYLKEYGFDEPEPIIADVGDMLIANTRGLHKRGRARPGTVRRLVVAKFRAPDPFLDHE